MRTASFLTLPLLPLLSLAAPTPAVDNAPSPASVKITGVSYGGSGCPQGTLNIVSTDSKVFTSSFDKFLASLGPGTAPAESRKNCQIAINLQYPAGYQFNVITADYKGYLGLSDGASATVKSTYYYAGDPSSVSTQEDFEGPMFTRYEKHDQLTDKHWSPCGSSQTLNINDQIRLNDNGNANAYGYGSTSNVDARFYHVLGVEWQKC